VAGWSCSQVSVRCDFNPPVLQQSDHPARQ